MYPTKTIATEDVLIFKESIKQNYVHQLPVYAKSIFEDEYSPFRKLLETVEPNKPVRLRIMLEIL